MKPIGNGKPRSKLHSGLSGRIGGRSPVTSGTATEGSDGPLIIALDSTDSEILLNGEGSSLPSLKRLGVTSSTPVSSSTPVTERSIEEKRLLIRKQLVVLLHSIVCRRRDLSMASRGESMNQV